MRPKILDEYPNLQYPPTGLSSGNQALTTGSTITTSLAVPSYGSILWQPYGFRICISRIWITCSTLLRVYPLATRCFATYMERMQPCSTLQRVYPLATPPCLGQDSLSPTCSTLQRVYPLATKASKRQSSTWWPCLQYPPTGLSSGNRT